MKGRLPPLLFGLALTVLAEVANRVGVLPAYVFPAPSAVLGALFMNLSELVRHSRQTLLETALGLGLAVLLGVLMAFWLQRWPLARRAALPWLVVSQTVPLVALAPLLLLLLGFGLLPKVLLVTLGGFFPITVSTLDALCRTDPDLIRVALSMNATRAQVERLIRWPAALPGFLSGLKVAATYAVPSAIFSEYIGAYAGLGVFLQTSVNARSHALVFATILVSALLSVLLVLGVELLSRRVLRWLPPQEIS